MRRLIVAAAASLILLLVPVPPSQAAGGESEDLLVFGVGAHDIGAFDDGNELSAGFQAEYRAGFGLWLVHPVIGLMVTSDSAVYGYGGIVVDIPVSDRVFITPSLAAGAYDEGSGQDLGHTVEFRTGIEVSYRLDDSSRIGIMFHHISNADLGGSNPGSESVFVNYMMPLGNIFGR